MSDSTMNQQNTFARWFRQLGSLRLRDLLSAGALINNLPFILFLGVLGLIYIGNTHLAERKIKRIEQLDREMRELRWQYTTTKANLMFRSKQTEVAKDVAKMDLKELTEPPKKIKVDPDEY